jgi:hypothetical protein
MTQVLFLVLLVILGTTTGALIVEVALMIRVKIRIARDRRSVSFGRAQALVLGLAWVEPDGTIIREPDRKPDPESVHREMHARRVAAQPELDDPVVRFALGEDVHREAHARMVEKLGITRDLATGELRRDFGTAAYVPAYFRDAPLTAEDIRQCVEVCRNATFDGSWQHVRLPNGRVLAVKQAAEIVRVYG